MDMKVSQIQGKKDEEKSYDSYLELFLKVKGVLRN